jgi:hypothetical protein
VFDAHNSRSIGQLSAGLVYDTVWVTLPPIIPCLSLSVRPKPPPTAVSTAQTKQLARTTVQVGWPEARERSTECTYAWTGSRMTEPGSHDVKNARSLHLFQRGKPGDRPLFTFSIPRQLRPRYLRFNFTTRTPPGDIGSTSALRVVAYQGDIKVHMFDNVIGR